MSGLSLYSISDQLNSILSALEDNGGELTEELEQALAITQEQFATKAVDYGHAILNIEAMAAAAKAEKDRLAKLQKFYENTAKRLRDAISGVMQAFDQPKVETASMRLFLHTTQAVADDYDINAIPDRFKTTKIEVVPNKADIKKAILAGEDVPGAHLQENVSLQIK